MKRFTKLDSAGKSLPAKAKDHVAVRDESTGLIWSANDISTEDLNWNDAKAACKKLKLCGVKGWSLPTAEQLLTLVDRSRFNPAINVDAFPTALARWYWASSVDASDPRSFAWGVYFGGGYCYFGNQYIKARVRAVRSAPLSSQ